MLRRASLLALCAGGLTACSLYFGDGDDEGGGGNTPPDGAIADAAVVPPTDAGRPGECQESEEAALDGLRTCMTMPEWEAAGLCDLSRMNTGEGPCFRCHSGGMDGIQLDNDCATTFEAMRSWPAQNDLVAPRIDDSGCFTGFDVGLICGGDGLPEGHPPFVCPTDLEASLADYLDATLQSWQSGACAADAG